MRFDDTSLDHAGLFRCCIHGVHMNTPREVEPGYRIVTKCCNEHVLLGEDGVWRWQPTGFVRPESARQYPGEERS